LVGRHAERYADHPARGAVRVAHGAGGGVGFSEEFVAGSEERGIGGAGNLVVLAVSVWQVAEGFVADPVDGGVPRR
jgi:hypothetical protein